MTSRANEIRRFAPAERSELRRIFLEALEDTPTAFATTLAHETCQPDAVWDRWLADNPPFGAFDGQTAVGLAGCRREPAANLVHRGRVGPMYVSPQSRGTDTAGRLLEAALSHLAGLGVEQVHLTVTGGNHRAERFYRRLGFAAYGIEPRGLKLGDQYHDLVMMVRILRP